MKHAHIVTQALQSEHNGIMSVVRINIFFYILNLWNKTLSFLLLQAMCLSSLQIVAFPIQASRFCRKLVHFFFFIWSKIDTIFFIPDACSIHKKLWPVQKIFIIVIVSCKIFLSSVYKLSQWRHKFLFPDAPDA